MNDPCVLLTRPAGENEALVSLLGVESIQTITMPAIAIKKVSMNKQDWQDFDGLVVVSPAAARSLRESGGEDYQGMIVAPGARTATMLEEHYPHASVFSPEHHQGLSDFVPQSSALFQGRSWCIIQGSDDIDHLHRPQWQSRLDLWGVYWKSLEGYTRSINALWGIPDAVNMVWLSSALTLEALNTTSENPKQYVLLSRSMRLLALAESFGFTVCSLVDVPDEDLARAIHRFCWFHGD